MLVDTKIEFINKLGIELIKDASLDEIIKALNGMITPGRASSYTSDSMEYVFINKIWEWLLELKRKQEKESKEWES